MSGLNNPPEIRVESAELHPGQLAVSQSEARFKVLVAGRRWGKDSLAVLECLHRHVEGIPWPEVRLL